MASDEEIAHLRELLDIYQRRKDELELQKAHFGRGRVPSDIALDYQEVDEAIARITAKLRLPSISQEVQAATGPEASIDVLRLKVKELGEQVNTALRWVTSIVLEMRAEASADRARNERERRFWQKLNFSLLILLVALVLYEVLTKR